MKEVRGIPPKISVLMACYNGEEWLEDAVYSILSQTFHEFEFIIVDDGSTDSSGAILEQISSSDRRIRVLSKPNTGLADSLNVGMREARGYWIARQDADDLSEPTRLERQYDYTRMNEDVVFVGSGLLQIDKRGIITARYRYPIHHKKLEQNLVLGRRFPAHSSAFYRKDIVLSLGGYRTCLRRAEDYDLWLRLSQCGRLAALSEMLIRYRVHDGQISHTENGLRQLIDSRIALTSYWLRKRGCVDPLSEGEKDQEEFVSWLEGKIREGRELEYIVTIKALKSLLKGGGGKSWVRGLKIACQHPVHLATYLYRLVRGDRTCARFAQAWVERARGLDLAT